MTTTAPKTRACKATCKTGKPCKGQALPNSDYCLFHDPTRATIRAAGRKLGGSNRQGRKTSTIALRAEASGQPLPPISLRTVEDVLGLIEETVNDVRLLENSNQRARTIASLAAVAIKALEIGEIEQRLRLIESILQNQNLLKAGVA